VVGQARVEITDLLWSQAPDGTRLPVQQAVVVERLRLADQRRAARIASRLPTAEGVLVPTEVDALGIRIHRELQRLSEELQFGARVAAVLQPLVAELAVRAGTVRIVDIGCGLGYVVRWLAARATFGVNVELIGMDLNPVLLAEASRLAVVEGLPCRFVCGDAFAPQLNESKDAVTIMISSGLLHHLAEPDLPAFFAAQARLGVIAFAHWDIAPCRWSTLGAWVFHQARMREPVSRHDGVLSARRAHSAPVLLAAASAGAPAYMIRVDEGSRWHPRALDVLRPIIGRSSR
jgi:SAM-dependent methyltransferase